MFLFRQMKVISMGGVSRHSSCNAPHQG